MDPIAPFHGAGDSRPQAAHILATIPLGLFVLDREWRFSFLNAYAERFFGQLTHRNRDQLLGQSIWRTCPEVADSVFVEEYLKATAESRRFEVEVFYPTLGRWFAIQAQLSPDCRCFYFQDVTARVELERTLRRCQEDLAEARRRQEESLLGLSRTVADAVATLRDAAVVLGRRGEAAEQVGNALAQVEEELRALSRQVGAFPKVARAPSEGGERAALLHP